MWHYRNYPVILLLFLLLLVGCGQKTTPPPVVPTAGTAENVELPQEPPEPAPAPEPEPLPEPDPKETTVEALLETMTLEEKVGQLFFIRLPDVNAAEKIENLHVGGVLLFTKDFKDSGGEWLSREAFEEKIQGLQEAADIPLLVGVDEEGGTVARASRNPNLFSEKCKSPQQLFAENKWTAIGEDAAYKNRDLLSYGINVNFAPVADVCTDPGDFMYDRSFGQDAQATADYVRWVVEHAATAAVRKIDEQGIAEEHVYRIGAVLKHFPGYGSNKDTHTGIAVDERSYEEFLEKDFLPFRAGIEAGAGAVLVSHNIVICMDDQLPASLSPAVHQVLREELGFEGVALTDDLAMEAVGSYAKDGSAAVLAVLAGNDMLVTGSSESQVQSVVDAVKDGTVEESIIDQALRRVLGWKYDLGLLETEGAEITEES